MSFPAARELDEILHGATSGKIGKPAGKCRSGTVIIEGRDAAHVYCTTACSGENSAVHPPQAPILVTGSVSVNIHGVPAVRRIASGDVAACSAQIATGASSVFIGGATEDASSGLALARQLVTTGGTGDLADADLVAREAAKMPKPMLQKLLDDGHKIVVCRGSIGEVRPEFKGETPRGHDGGDLTDLPGLYDPNKKEVLIATTGHDTPEGAHVPKNGEGHGSENLVVHETAHAYDHATGSSLDKEFTDARSKDANNIPAYEKQHGDHQKAVAGLEEAYAESLARHTEGKDGNTPNLDNYWDTHP
jgi:uncharacterized Zn-binding protein involved in type VI secretion